ncbi:Rne/Rng family ribonuclease [Brevundimonas sp. AJA228-03]|uniref:Rne/Rng family ribonuclease n=1 Tax=Brevundimonas sp. AJA228-03 TaxID=2752515 RepID=UPI001ADF559F|nr:Rne/Rng family ribonuclease [Brevundimonas sp. AJA228-03]QTN18675.1 Rne/Rng family ribonuclease [Brevundimonas sp. AJA228-03]
MSKTMLIDAAHAEETRVAIVDGRQVEEFDFESKTRRQLRGNIYLAKVTRVEPSLQAAFVEYGGNRHGFLAFNEIHPDYYQIPAADREAIMAEAHSADDDHDDENARDSDDGDSEGGMAEEERLKRRLMRRYKIQDVIKRRQILLVQVVKDERGGKGAALTTWLSLAGRYCVLMPNTGKGGGISRKITQATDRKRLKAAAAALDVPRGMGLIIRTAGAKRTKAEIKRDYEYLLRLWETIRETTLASHAPSLIYEEENLVRRAVRDMFDKDFDGIQVEGLEGFKEARDFMRVLMPSQARKVHLYQGSRPLFAANGIEELLTQIHQPVVPLKSGGYLVINQTEALVAIDVNSGRATKERNVEATAFKTNCEAAVEAARQLRLRDLAGLVVIDFIDMDESKNNRTVERILKDELSFDRARIQMGRISGFGLMEISRQRRRLGVLEGATEVCPHCQGAGRVRSAESAALMVLRAVDIEAGKNGAGSINLKVSSAVALYILNHKRDYLQRLLERRGLAVIIQIDDRLGQGESAIERTETNEDFVAPEAVVSLADLDDDFDDSAYSADDDNDADEDFIVDDDDDLDREDTDDDEPRERAERDEGERGRGRGRRRRGGRRDEEATPIAADAVIEGVVSDDDDDSEAGRRRRRGRRGGRRVREDGDTASTGSSDFFWVRGRTPSLEDPYVWFDPLNPPARAERGERPSANSAPVQTRRDVEEQVGERPEGEIAGDREGGRSRRRRRGRGRGGERSTPHDLKVEGDATSEGMPADGSPDAPMAVMLADDASEAPAPVVTAEPQRRRVRRKSSTSVADTPSDAIVQADAEDAVPPMEPEIAFVAEASEPVAEAEPAILVEAVEPPMPEADLSAIIANDPAQITAPPVKPKRGWWRLGS